MCYPTKGKINTSLPSLVLLDPRNSKDQNRILEVNRQFPMGSFLDSYTFLVSGFKFQSRTAWLQILCSQLPAFIAVPPFLLPSLPLSLPLFLPPCCISLSVSVSLLLSLFLFKFNNHYSIRLKSDMVISNVYLFEEQLDKGSSRQNLHWPSLGCYATSNRQQIPIV